MILIRHYSNKKIYTNFRIAHILSLVAFIFAVFTLCSNIFQEYLNYPHSNMTLSEKTFFYLYLFLIPLTIYSTSKKTRGRMPTPLSYRK